MRQDIKEKFPTWCLEDTKYNLCLTDDIDSLFSCRILEKICGHKIGYFYNFDYMCGLNGVDIFNGTIGVDMDIMEGKCWGNHVVVGDNFECANLNRIVNIKNNNYLEKYSGSVLLQIISYYNIDISNLTKEQCVLLLAIDGTFMSYYFNKDLCKYYLVDILELKELYNVLETTNQGEFERIIKKYNTRSKIYINKNGMLETDIDINGLNKLFNLDIELPKEQLFICYELETYSQKVSDIDYIRTVDIFSLAVTRRNLIKYSRII